ncbi:MAG TPA: MotA/TolQ/ExbB proton channel family protein [Vicinamibacterales bacterium]|nr:MotA/TolQ/ExbB proton channel family protein [Vicinamibacterales bacterium]
MRTLGSPLLALLVQGAAGSLDGTGPNTGIVNLISRATPLSIVILTALTLLSVWSWGIFLYKWWTFRRAAHQSAQFLDVFRRSNKFSEVQAIVRSVGESPLVGLFQTGYAELTAQLRQTAPDVGNGPNPRPAAGRPTLKSVAAVDRALLRASAVEVNKLESHIGFLATVASMAPFVGLFGTVWGIMNAFEQIGVTGSTNLQAVGTPIAEALIATAMGLAAAIPAVLFYNYLTQRVKLFASEMDDFSMEFLNIAERNFT